PLSGQEHPAARHRRMIAYTTSRDTTHTAGAHGTPRVMVWEDLPEGARIYDAGQYPVFGTARPHHNRTRSSGEQRGTTVKVVELKEATAQPFDQVSAQARRK
ncbi:hypothetical protein RMT89_39935, partial [Streptomyces sp. P17]|nr:hypothetical protein [Streptomyces sp. P17]